MSSTSVTLLVTVIIGLGVIGAGVWRVASAVSKLVGKVDLLDYRVGQLEKRQRQVVAAVMPRRRRRSTGPGSNGD